MIRIAFRYNDRRPLARLICLVQGGDSAHCEVSWSWLGYTHECVSASWVDGGVRGKEIEMPPEKWRIYELPGSPELVKGWLDVNQGAPYDFLGLLGFVVRRIKGRRRAWFCSEVAAELIGLPDPHRYDPALVEGVCARIGRRVDSYTAT